jgi:hypothetical protein
MVSTVYAQGMETGTDEFAESPFGAVVSATGTEASNNFFRFSTKYQDAETGLDYYGYSVRDQGQPSRIK